MCPKTSRKRIVYKLADLLAIQTATAALLAATRELP